MIPKILHHTAPTDKTKWGPFWNKCLDSWYNQYPTNEYEHIFWTDEDLDILVSNDYPEYFDLYRSFPFHIMRIDFARYLMLHKFGGLYVDMDYYCYKNFHSMIKDADLVLIEALVRNEIVTNSMMASEPNHPFWIDCLEETRRFNYPYTETLDLNHYILDITGPFFLSRMAMRSEHKIHILNKKDFNPDIEEKDESIVVRHMLTGVWGWGLHEEELIECYKRHRNIDPNTYEF